MYKRNLFSLKLRGYVHLLYINTLLFNQYVFTRTDELLLQRICFG